MSKPQTTTDTQDITGTDVAVIRKASVDVAMLGELEQALLTGKAPVEVTSDPEEVSRQLIAALLSAESDEELERSEAVGWQKLEGVPVEIHDFVWRPSTFDEGQPVFLVVRAFRVDTGEPLVLTTGSGQVMAILANLAKRDRLPAIRELRSAETKQKGRTVLWLATPDAIAEQRRKEAAAAREQAAATADEPVAG